MALGADAVMAICTGLWLWSWTGPGALGGPRGGCSSGRSKRPLAPSLIASPFPAGKRNLAFYAWTI